MGQQTLQGIATGAAVAPGSLVGGRFLVETLTTTLGSIAVYGARDQKTQRAVALWMISRGVLEPDAVEATRKAIRGAASVAHKDLVVPFGSAVNPDGTLCVATEPLGTRSLVDVLAERPTEASSDPLALAYPTVNHVITALRAVHATLAHGAICPVLVRLDDGGRARLAGAGMLKPLVSLGAVDLAYVSPEVRSGAVPTAQSDIFSVGALLYALLTGKAPEAGVSASSLVPGLAPTLDIILESCLADDPAERFETVAALQGALAALVAPTERPPETEDVEIPVDFDMDDPSGTPEEARVSAVRPAPGGAPPTEGEPAGAGAPDGHPSEGDLGSLLKVVTANDADRWMFSHHGLDHGPLTARELIAAIVRQEAVGDDAVLNMETGERKSLIEWPQYREFVETASDKRRGDERKVAARAAIAHEGVSRASKLVIALAVAATFALVGFAYYKTLGAGARRQHSAAEIDDLVARGQLRVQTQAIQLLPPEPPAAHAHHAGGGGGGGGGSYEAAMSAAIDFNFNGTVQGGTLNDAEIVRPLNASLGRFAGCLADGSARNVTLRIAIGGTGRAIGVTVNNGSGSVRSCVGGVVRSLSWRAFGGPRIGLSWGFGF